MSQVQSPNEKFVLDHVQDALRVKARGKSVMDCNYLVSSFLSSPWDLTNRWKGKKGIVEESSAPPPSISVDAEQINPKDIIFEYRSPATFYPSPSTKQSFLEYKRADGNRGGFWHLERDDGEDEICRLV
jgi:hypothetical protein